MAVVVFDPAAFKIRYPAFAAVSDALLQLCFNEAGLYCANTDTSKVQNITTRTMLLWMLTAHIAYLGGALNPGNTPNPVGRVSQATEGSVSASMEYNVPGTAAWFAQTEWGASFWQATMQWRSMRYSARPTYVGSYNPFGPPGC